VRCLPLISLDQLAILSGRMGEGPEGMRRTLAPRGTGVRQATRRDARLLLRAGVWMPAPTCGPTRPRLVLARRKCHDRATHADCPSHPRAHTHSPQR
jgi:hypothetical protein